MSRDLEKQMTHFNFIVKERQCRLTRLWGCGISVQGGGVCSPSFTDWNLSDNFITRKHLIYIIKTNKIMVFPTK